jgi:uncharacterized protein
MKRTRWVRNNRRRNIWLKTMPEVFHRSFFLNGPAGGLEASLWTSPDPKFVAVVCHPHPLFGGTMHNKVVFQAAKTLHQRGATVLRFNFRGVEQSDGIHDRGVGELDDVRTAVTFLATEFPGRPILVAGFSFGSWIGLRVGCEDARVTRLVGLGLPVNHVDASYLRVCAKPKLLMQGANDQYASPGAIKALFATLAEPKCLVIVDDADHFFTGHLDEVGAAITLWLDALHSQSGPVESGTGEGTCSSS